MRFIAYIRFQEARANNVLLNNGNNIHGRNDFAERSKILAGYRSEK